MAQQNALLTSSQEKALKECVEFLAHFPVLVLKGDPRSGKHTVLRELFRRGNHPVVNFDLYRLSIDLDKELSNQRIISHLQELLVAVVQKVSAFDDKSLYGVIYFRNYNQINDVLTDCNSKLRFFLPLIMKNFFDNLPDNIRVVISTNGCLLPEGFHWTVELCTSKDDMREIMTRSNTYSTVQLTETQIDNLLKISKVVTVGRILYCLRYANAVSDSNLCLLTDFSTFSAAYSKALGKIAGGALDIDKDVPKPDIKEDLIGMDDILDAINTSIILPMQLNIPGVNIKKGIIICGPPGTGKTSIGKWLAHQIKGKFYLVGGAITGSDLVDSVEHIVKKAYDNSPAVIFIDDCDILFTQDDVYRGFLTLLDGVETNKRNDICFVLTCMDLHTIPASLIRGGRLEMVLITRLPDTERIKIILEKALHKMRKILQTYNAELTINITPQLLSEVSNRMSGWNCADIHRSVNDVMRVIIAKNIVDLHGLFEKSVRQVQEQYLLCGRCESTNIDEKESTYYS